MTEKIKQFEIEKIGDPEAPFVVIHKGRKYNQALGEFETKKEAEHYICRLLNYKLLFCKKCEVKFIETMKTDVFYCPCCGKFFKQDKNIMKEISKEIGYCNETEKKLVEAFDFSPIKELLEIKERLKDDDGMVKVEQKEMIYNEKVEE